MKKIFLTLLSVTTLSTATTFAQGLKIGFVQSEYVLGLLPEAKAARQDVAAFERKLNNKLTAMRQGLELQAAQLQQEAANLSDTVRAVREQELQELQQDILSEQETAQQQMQFKVMQAMSPLRQKVQQTIDSVAQLNGYTHIFPASVNGQAMLVYTQNPEESNVTPLIIEALGLSEPTETSGQ
ncbi:OmpH family outer membrane protein [Tunicatimonas pelagia]|uniref:OmpH family outer membrane protein n=1 Tax=Tunicatimonas pelagia TaxID=931531 RepID=UPI002666AD94|nr:OmpH family outer membrane protein [Tunicatimonas pelagia]WKN43323.1 OmpH family outer membrane protein [Tunicatimonas pelagia]